MVRGRSRIQRRDDSKIKACGKQDGRLARKPQPGPSELRSGLDPLHTQWKPPNNRRPDLCPVNRHHTIPGLVRPRRGERWVRPRPNLHNMGYNFGHTVAVRCGEFGKVVRVTHMYDNLHYAGGSTFSIDLFNALLVGNANPRLTTNSTGYRRVTTKSTGSRRVLSNTGPSEQ